MGVEPFTSRRSGTELISFAAIIDEPSAEVATAGHDRCIGPTKAEHINGWLNADPHTVQVLYAIVDDRTRPHCEHCLAA